jgi:hypothetical protein
VNRQTIRLPHVAFRDYGDYCDAFGNLLAILFSVANPAQEKRILDYLHQVWASTSLTRCECCIPSSSRETKTGASTVA